MRLFSSSFAGRGSLIISYLLSRQKVTQNPTDHATGLLSNCASQKMEPENSGLRSNSEAFLIHFLPHTIGSVRSG